MVMGGDSCFKGREFKSQHHILDGHIYTFICCKKCNVCLKKMKINVKETEDGHLKKVNLLGLGQWRN